MCLTAPATLTWGTLNMRWEEGGKSIMPGYFRSQDMGCNNSGAAGLPGRTTIVGATVCGRRQKLSCRKAVEQLVGEREEQVVLFGGTSAGGRGSMVEFITNVFNNHDQMSSIAICKLFDSRI